MTKLTRKLLISVFTLAFAFVTLGATTFAWFTLSSTVTVSDLEFEASTGRGFELSVDGVTYKNKITLADINAAITAGKQKTMTGLTLQAITSPNGFEFYEFDSIAPTSDGYYELNLWFRTAEEDVVVFLDIYTKISSNAQPWTSDAKFGSFLVDEVYDIYAADSLRLSFQEYTGDEDSSFDAAIPDRITIWELDPERLKDGDHQSGNTRLTTWVLDVATTSTLTDGNLYKYWDSKSLKTEIESVRDNETYGYGKVPNGYSSASLGATDDTANVELLVLDQVGPDSNYLYGYLKVRFWLEGWDPDNFDSLFGKNVSIYLSFGLAYTEE